jgi:D-proline reductase (dithiol) PrdB
LWETINERYPGSMIRKDSYVPLAQLGKPLAEARLTLISSCGVHARNDRPLDVCHPFGDFLFRRVPSQLRHEDLIIHQLKYPHGDADVDINVIFPIQRLQELGGRRSSGRPYGQFLQIHRL